jgi:hypothetical protein
VPSRRDPGPPLAALVVGQAEAAAQAGQVRSMTRTFIAVNLARCGRRGAARTQRVMSAMLKMTKIDIAELERAYAAGA